MLSTSTPCLLSELVETPVLKEYFLLDDRKPRVERILFE